MTSPKFGLYEMDEIMNMDKSIGFIGAGNMGGALIRGLLSTGTPSPSDLIVSDYSESVIRDLNSEYSGIRTSSDNTNPAAASVVVIAVKPQNYESVVQDIKNIIQPEAIIVSIAAGLPTTKMGRWFNPGAKIVRAMPNMPAMVREGMTALCCNRNVSDAELQIVRKIFDSVGKCIILPESLMDTYTALAGSGPAWIFVLIEALADGAVREGISRSAAYEIASQVVAGSARLLSESKLHPAILKDRICSPGGTTIEAMAALESAGFRSAIIQAVSICARRARELSNER